MRRLVYAVLRVPDEGPDALSTPAQVKCHISGELGVAYSETEVDALTPTVQRLKAFAEMVDKLHRRFTVVPFRYGCALDSDDQLAELLAERRPAWLAALDSVARCDEYSVHLLPSSGSAGGNSTAETDQTAPARSQTAARPGTAYLLARQAEMARAAGHQKHARDRAEKVRRALEGHYRGYHFDPDAARPGELLTLVFLVPRASKAAFLQAIDQLPEMSSEQVLTTGPWPPYNFVDPVAKLDTGANHG
ncbi:MAG: GvpL/GvpF family gas vesicle protein [Isosphaeraceae bacterium]